jgi:hypothetical protein
MATKSRKRTKKSPRATAAMMKDLKAVFDKHNWPGHPIGFADANPADSGGCPPGTSPQTVSFQLPDGTQVTKTMCLPDDQG